MTDTIKKFFGFAKHGQSLLGKMVSRVAWNKRFRKVLSVVVVIVLAFGTILPGVSLAAINVTTPASKAETVTKTTVKVPVSVNYISRGFSWFHFGIDLVADFGKPVSPVMDGEVKSTVSDWLGYGKHVIIDHGGGFVSLYGHLSQIEVKVGDKVTIESEIGKVGSTGFSTGPHLHLEIYQDGKAIDPAEILPEIIVK